MSKKDKTPEDSTLRRHQETEQKLNTGSGGKSSSHSGRPGASSSHGSHGDAGRGGIVGWLKRLFSG